MTRMTAFDKGMNVTEVRDSADAFVRFSRESGQTREDSEHAILLIDRYWDGPDKQRLMERWHSLQPQLRHVELSLQALSRHLHRDADLQSQASGGRHAAGSGGPSGATHSGAGAAGGFGRPAQGGATVGEGRQWLPVDGDAGHSIGTGGLHVPPESIQVIGATGANLGVQLRQ